MLTLLPLVLEEPCTVIRFLSLFRWCWTINPKQLWKGKREEQEKGNKKAFFMSAPLLKWIVYWTCMVFAKPFVCNLCNQYSKFKKDFRTCIQIYNRTQKVVKELKQICSYWEGSRWVQESTWETWKCLKA